MNIVSLIQVDEEWVEQKKIPQEKVEKIIEKVMDRAGVAIGAEVITDIKRRRAGN